MNELIEFVWEHCKHPLIKEEFAEAIQTACKAQRNACFSAYYDHIHDTSELIIAEILTAEISKEDYE